MAHASITPNDSDRYYAGDSIDIPFAFTDQHGDTAIDLTGMTVEFRLKHDLTDTDSDAVVVKTGTEGGTTDGVSFASDPTTGECTVHIDTDDTSSVVIEDSTRFESVVMDWHVRVIDGNGNRVTSEVGDWEIFAS